MHYYTHTVPTHTLSALWWPDKWAALHQSTFIIDKTEWREEGEWVRDVEEGEGLWKERREGREHLWTEGMLKRVGNKPGSGVKGWRNPNTHLQALKWQNNSVFALMNSNSNFSPLFSISDDPADVRHGSEWWRACASCFQPIRHPWGRLARSSIPGFRPDPQHSAVEVTRMGSRGCGGGVGSGGQRHGKKTPIFSNQSMYLQLWLYTARTVRVPQHTFTAVPLEGQDDITMDWSSKKQNEKNPATAMLRL